MDQFHLIQSTLTISQLPPARLTQVLQLANTRLLLLFESHYVVYETREAKIIAVHDLKLSNACRLKGQIAAIQQNSEVVLLDILSGQVLIKRSLHYIRQHQLTPTDEFLFGLISFDQTNTLCIVKKKHIYSYIGYVDRSLAGDQVREIKCETIEKYDDQCQLVTYIQRITHSLTIKLVNLQTFKQKQFTMPNNLEINLLLLFVRKISNEQMLLVLNNNCISKSLASYFVIFNHVSSTITRFLINTPHVIDVLTINNARQTICLHTYRKNKDRTNQDLIAIYNYRNPENHFVLSTQVQQKYSDGSTLIGYNRSVRQETTIRLNVVRWTKKQSLYLHLVKHAHLNQRYSDSILHWIIELL